MVRPTATGSRPRPRARRACAGRRRAGRARCRSGRPSARRRRAGGRSACSSRAACARRGRAVTGTSRQPRTAQALLGGDLARCAASAARALGRRRRAGRPCRRRTRRPRGRSTSTTARRKASGTWVRMPAPSPTSGSAPVAPRWSRLRSAVERVLDDVVAGAPAHRRHEGHTAGVVLVLAAVQAGVGGLGGEARRRSRRITVLGVVRAARGTGHGKVRRGRLWPRLGRISPRPSPSCYLSRAIPHRWDSGSLCRAGSLAAGPGGP